MENASKALIIAGAILISIIIIGLGVYFVNMASSVGKKVDLTSQEAQAQNEQFLAYRGARQSATQVRSLMNIITTNNITGATGEENKYIYVAFKGATGSLTITSPTTVSQNVKAGKTYNVYIPTDTGSDENVTAYAENMASYYTTGYIKVIAIEQN